MIPRHTSRTPEAEPESQLKINKILVPIDFSEHSEKALLYGALIAERFEAQLQLLHVIQSPATVYDLGHHLEISDRLEEELKTRSKQKLDELVAKMLKPSLDVVCKIRAGNSVEEIIENAKSEEIDLIVTSTHGRTGLQHVVLGSVVEGMVRYAPCPVFVVRNLGTDFVKKDETGGARFDLKTVLVALDFSGSSDFALHYAETIARRSGAALVLTHVAPIHFPVSEYGVLECPVLDAELLEAGERYLREVAEREREKNISVQHEVRQGSAGVEIVGAAAHVKADLIVMGTRGLTGLKHALLGSTAVYVLRHARCPVLIIRERSRVHEERALPSASKRRIKKEVLHSIVSTHPFLKGMATEDIEILLKDAVVTEFPADKVIFREGDYADKFYLINEGKVAVEFHTPEEDILVQTLGGGDVLGWSWLFPPFAWQFQARCLEATVALELDGAQIRSACETNDKLGHHLMKRFAQLLIRQLQQTEKRILERWEKEEMEELGETL